MSRIENGRRPATQKGAAACDRVFPGRHGWFLGYYEESRHWGEIPPGFRDWSELEEQATRLYDWWPSIVSGFLQTEDYARALLSTYPGVSSETVSARLANRMERQRRVLMREDPPTARFLVDEMALYRHVGSPQIMAEQMRHLSAVAALPTVTIQVLPAFAHPANTSGFIVAGDSAWCELSAAAWHAFTTGLK